ncbi:MAG: hypothetical protein WC712_08805 [Candidatus Brocadiia bacterium]
MNYLRRFYLEREIRKLEERIKESPDPNDFIRLVPLYAEMGETGKADSLKAKGKELFPAVDFSRIVYEKPESGPGFNTGKEVQDIKLELTDHPNPWLYGKLARLHLNGGELDQAEEVARGAQKLYPTHPYPYIIMAEVAVLRNDRVAAATNFDQAIKLDSQSAISIVHLCEYYQEVKDFDRTRKLLESLLIPQKGAFAAAPPAPGQIPSSRSSDAQSMSSSVRESVRVKAPMDEAMTPEKSTGLTDIVARLRTQKFIQGVIISDHDGQVQVADLPYSLDQGDVGKAMSNLYLSAMTQAKQMTLGSYLYNAFEGESGGFLIVQTPTYVVGLLFDKRRRLDQDQEEIFEFCRQLF